MKAKRALLNLMLKQLIALLSFIFVMAIPLALPVYAASGSPAPSTTKTTSSTTKKAISTVPADCQGGTFFGLEPWYHYLTLVQSKTTNECEVCFNIKAGDTNYNSDCPSDTGSDIPLVLIAIVDDLLRIAGLVAVAFVIYAGVEYILSQGNPEQTAKAQSGIVNSLIGLAIAVTAVGAVSFVGDQLGGNTGTPSYSTSNQADLSSLPGQGSGFAGSTELHNILTIIFTIIGSLALLVIVISGLRYINSAGDPQKASQAKNGIIYALVGLVVVIAAQIIVSYVIGNI